MTFDKLQLLLAAIRIVDDSAIVAGGAVRDILNGKPIKDVDVFLKSNGDPFTTSKFVASNIGAAITRNQIQDTSEYDDIVGVVDLTKVDYPPIQLVFQNEDPIDYIHRYDFDICKVFMTPGGVFMTEDYLRDMADKTLTYRDEANFDDKGRYKSLNHLQRLKAKFPGFTARNAEILLNLPLV